MPETKQAARPLSYYMRNGLWYFTLPPDTLSGQVIPKSTVENWLEKTLEREAEITRLREQAEQRITVEQAMEFFGEAMKRNNEAAATEFFREALSKLTQR